MALLIDQRAVSNLQRRHMYERGIRLGALEARGREAVVVRALRVVAFVLIAVGMLACHHQRTRSQPEPVPVAQAIPPAGPPSLTDAEWIDSLAASWAALGPSRQLGSAKLTNAKSHSAHPTSSAAAMETASTVSATSFAEAAERPATFSRAAMIGSPTPLAILFGIAFAALLLTLGAGYIAFR